MMITGVKKNTVPAGRVIYNGAPNFSAVGTIHNNCSHGVGSEIHPNGE
jgi:hypothetical protein